MSGFKKAFITKVTGDWRDAATQPTDTLGDIREVGNKVYKYVKWAASASAEVDVTANGDAVCYSDYSANLITADITDIDGVPAGVIVNFANWSAPTTVGDLSDRGYGLVGWIQIKGPATASGTVKTSAQAGDRIDMTSSGVTDLFFTLHAPTHTAGADHVPCGVLLHAANKELYLDCPY